MDIEVGTLVLEQALDYCFKGKFHLDMYEYLKKEKATKGEVQIILESAAAQNITTTIYDLEDYLEGGSDTEHKQLREAYGFLGKPEARKIKNFLEGILEGAWKYEQERKPGRRKKHSK